MKETTKIIIIVLVASVIGGFVGGLVGNQSGDAVGSGTRFPSGLSADGTSPTTGEVRGTTLTVTGAATMGGDITVTTTNSATSSIEVGCVDTYATSTDTAVRLSATTTPGIAYWTYGTCSSL